MQNRMQSISPQYYQNNSVQINVNRPMQTMVQQQRASYQTGPLSIKLKQYDLFPGQVAEGSVILQTPTVMILNDIYLHLVYTESWVVQGQTSLSETNEKIIGSICLGIAKILKINGALIKLNPGTYDFPFQFKIPDNLPPCFEFPKTNVKAYLRYIFRANIYSQYTKGATSFTFFIKAKSKIYQTPLGYTSSTPMLNMGMNNPGSTTLKVSIKGTSYVIKGQIPFTVEIDNTRGKVNVKSVLAKIVRRIELKKVREVKDRFIFENVIAARVYQVNLPPYTKSQILNYIFQIDDTTIREFIYYGLSNPYPKLINIFYVMPSVDSLAIKCSYFLVVTLDFAQMIPAQYSPKITFPIHLNHQEMQDIILQTQNHQEIRDNIPKTQKTEDLGAPMSLSLIDNNVNNNINNADLKIEEEQKFEKPGEDNVNSINDNNNENEKEVNDINDNIINIHMKDINKIMDDNDDIKVNKNIENIKSELKGILNALASGEIENNINKEKEENNEIFEKEQNNDINNAKEEENNINKDDNNVNNEINDENENKDKNEFSIFG